MAIMTCSKDRFKILEMGCMKATFKGVHQVSKMCVVMSEGTCNMAAQIMEAAEQSMA